MKVLFLSLTLLSGGCAWVEHEPPVPGGSRLFVPLGYAHPSWSLLSGDSMSPGVSDEILLKDSSQKETR